MKIAILGAGAMGGLYGGILAEQGHEVWFVDVFEPLVEAVNSRGFRIVEGEEERVISTIRATSNPADVGQAELVIVFVKSTYTESAAFENKVLFGEKTIALTLQNGMGNIEKLEKVVDRKQIIAGTSANGANTIEPGKINHAGKGGTTIGELDGQVTPRIKEIHKILNLEHLGPCTISENVMGLIWDKVLINVGINALTALTRMRNGDLLKFPETKELMTRLVAEAEDVAKAEGVQLSSPPLEKTIKVAQATSENLSSMLSDVLNGRQTEISTINGAIVELGKKHGVATPANQIITNLMTGLEQYLV